MTAFKVYEAEKKPNKMCHANDENFKMIQLHFKGADVDRTFFYSEHNDIKCSYLIQQAISESYDKCGSLYLLNRCPVGKGKKQNSLLNRLKSPSGAALI